MGDRGGEKNGCGPVRRFEDLQAWKGARKMVSAVYQSCRSERVRRDFGFCDQLQRAAVSVMTNIAEGFEREHVREKLQFYNIARASIGEVRSLLYVLSDNYPDLSEQAASLREEAIRIGRMLTGLIRSTKRRLTTS